MTSDAEPTVSRRAVIAGAGGAVAAVIAAYAVYDRVAGNGSGGAATSGVLGTTSDFPVGGGKVLADQQVVVTQPTAGDFRCFSAICTHTGCTVNEVARATINCPCHGSRFDIADGSVVKGPARLPLPTRTVTVEGTTVTLA